jgi:hypothetical protein
MRRTARWAMLALLAVAAPAAWADWIVTKDGGKFEIKGAWAQKGKMVVFTTPNGTLSSLRGDRIDFDASKRATEAAKKEAEAPDSEPPADPAKAKKKSVWVLTDKDFKKGAQAAEPADKGDKAKDAAAKDTSKDMAPGSSQALQVVKWDRVTPTDPAAAKGSQITGRVQNNSVDLQADLAVTVSFFDDAGTLVARVPGEMSTNRLQPNESATFSATAPGVFSFSSVKFEAKAIGFKLKGQEPPPPTASTAPPSRS